TSGGPTPPAPTSVGSGRRFFTPPPHGDGRSKIGSAPADQVLLRPPESDLSKGLGKANLPALSTRNQRLHLPHRLLKSNEDRPRDNAVSNVEFPHARNPRDWNHVAVIQPMPHV